MLPRQAGHAESGVVSNRLCITECRALLSGIEYLGPWQNLATRADNGLALPGDPAAGQGAPVRTPHPRLDARRRSVESAMARGLARYLSDPCRSTDRPDAPVPILDAGSVILAPRGRDCTSRPRTTHLPFRRITIRKARLRPCTPRPFRLDRRVSCREAPWKTSSSPST